MKSGYLYVLIHPSDPALYKVGMTTRHPEERLVEHNTKYSEYAGQIVKETGQKWELKTYIAVPDTNWAETVFWGATGFGNIPYRRGIEVERMEWKCVQAGLEAVKSAGVRRPPKQLPDYVYAYTASVKKRLEGRGITLIGHVKSRISGRNNFQCSNGHVWRTIPNNVAEGEGCPQCGMGQRTPEEIRQAAKSGVLFLLTHPDQPGLVKIGLTYRTLEECDAESNWDGWQVHRYRNVDEPVLAESLIWELLGHPLPNDREPISIDLHIAEQAFRDLHGRLVSEIASAEKAKE
ncbi:GIY-YIG nuclease family protein [Bradyrhizobium pachyrhizi]|uniref:GIY-YIG nuclease family protein n=1 Tax=Bradyrhizobium pachyrhizi TaxID=280333 RepID=UPI000B14B968|nr:GIY-YIG nuclease family protein [Bradyrhizobium pachyrhizi]